MPASNNDNPTSHDVDRALTSVSVASMHVQLVRRWMERGEFDRADQMLESLRTSERALWDAAETVREMRALVREAEELRRGE